MLGEEVDEKSQFIPKSVNHDRGMEMVDMNRVCRNCHDSDPIGDLIAPCRCNGSIKWVHRECLNQWRAVSPDPKSFSICDVCHTTYQLEYIPDEEVCCANWRYHFYVTRDFLALFFLINLTTTIFSVILHFADPSRHRDFIFQEIGWKHPIPLLADWLEGWMVLLFIIGIAAIFYAIARFCCSCDECECCRAPSHNTYGYNTYGYYYFGFWYIPPYHSHTSSGCCDCGTGANSCNGTGCSGGDCNCSGGGGSNDCGDAGAILLVIAVIIIALIILMGLVVAIFLIISIGAAICKRHLNYLAKKDMSARYIVKDLSQDPYHV